MIIAAAQASFFTGREKTRIVMLVDTTAVLLNAALDYMWIFGRLGFSAHGIVGAAWATTPAEWFRVFVYGWLMLRPAMRQLYHMSAGWRPQAAMMGRLWRYCLFDALNVVFVSAIRGAGDMRFVLWTTLGMSPAPLLATWWGISRQGWGLLWCWAVITAWVCSLGLIYLGRFLQGRWRQMRVIEPETAP